MNKNPKIIYFDCFDTRLHITEPKKYVWMSDICTALNIDMSTLKKLLLTTDKNLYATLTEQYPEARYDSTAIDTIAEASHAINREQASTKLLPGALELFHTLDKRWYRMGLISNISYAYKEPVYGSLPIDFDEILFSCELWYTKTLLNDDYRIYERAHFLAWCDKEDILMIWDNYHNDYLAAKNYGFNAIHLDRKDKKITENRISKLTDLLALVE